MAGRPRTFVPPELLRRLYHDEDLSLSETADRLGMTTSAVYWWLKRWGIPRRRPGGREGEKSHQWRGGRVRYPNGYWMVMRKDHPRANASGYVPEHVLVMEEHLGRPLEPGEQVHHINHDKGDNEPTNLIVCSAAQHMKWERKADYLIGALMSRGSLGFDPARGGYYLVPGADVRSG